MNKLKPMINTPIKPMQRKLYYIYWILYRILFGLNHPGDYPGNHNALVHIGEGCVFARTVQFITAKHDPENPKDYLESEPIVIGNNCWLGANVVVLSGVELGDYTTVGAGSVVTKSFPNGECVIAGVPARKIDKNGGRTNG